MTLYIREQEVSNLKKEDLDTQMYSAFVNLLNCKILYMH